MSGTNTDRLETEGLELGLPPHEASTNDWIDEGNNES